MSSTPGKGGLFFEMMTPILMAAQKNDHEAYELLTDLGHSIPVSIHSTVEVQRCFWMEE